MANHTPTITEENACMRHSFAAMQEQFVISLPPIKYAVQRKATPAGPTQSGISSTKCLIRHLHEGDVCIVRQGARLVAREGDAQDVLVRVADLELGGEV